MQRFPLQWWVFFFWKASLHEWSASQCCLIQRRLGDQDLAPHSPPSLRWLRTRPRRPSQTYESLSALAVIVPFIWEGKQPFQWPRSRISLIPEKPDEGRRAEDAQVEVAKFRGKRERKSWFCVLCAKGPCGSIWWHSTSLTRQCLGAATLGSGGDLLTLIRPEPFSHSRKASPPFLKTTAALKCHSGVISHIFKTCVLTLCLSSGDEALWLAWFTHRFCYCFYRYYILLNINIYLISD